MKQITFHPSQIDVEHFTLFGKQGISLFDTDIDENVWLYFALKNKHDALLTNNEECLETLLRFISGIEFQYDVVIWPESRSGLNLYLSTHIVMQNKPGICPRLFMEKRSKDEIIEIAHSFKWRKEEWASQERCFAEMGETFEINKIKSNQRYRYIPYLFRPFSQGQQNVLNECKRVLIVDDSLFSGTTVRGQLHHLDGKDVEIFSLFRCRSFRER